MAPNKRQDPKHELELARAYQAVMATEDGALVMRDLLSACHHQQSAFRMRQDGTFCPYQVVRQAAHQEISARISRFLTADLARIHQTIEERAKQ